MQICLAFRGIFYSAWPPTRKGGGWARLLSLRTGGSDWSLPVSDIFKSRATFVVCNCFRLLTISSCTLSLFLVSLSSPSLSFPFLLFCLSPFLSFLFFPVFTAFPDLRHARVEVERGSSHHGLEDRIGQCLHEFLFAGQNVLWPHTILQSSQVLVHWHTRECILGCFQVHSLLAKATSHTCRMWASQWMHLVLIFAWLMGIKPKRFATL